MDLYDYYRNMENKKIILAYKGNVSGELFNGILELAENKLTKIESKSRLKKKVFNILVEVLQNIYHHLDEVKNMEDDFYEVLFILSRDNNSYKITTGNHLRNDKVSPLKTRLEYINSMDLNKIKEVYREKLNSGVISDKGGAGLGIIDIARKSGRPMDFNFSQINDDFSFFSLEVEVGL